MFSEASCSKDINYFMSILYRSKLFLSAEDSAAVCKAGWHFLQGYNRLAMLTFQDGNPKFTLIPKIHMMWHLVHKMHVQSQHCKFVLNPMAESCSVEEDVIGRFCYLTRHVSPRMRIIRSLERYLTQVLLVWSR